MTPDRDFARTRLTVLMFHRVGTDASDAIGLEPVSPQRFERYLRWISAAGYTPIALSDWRAARRSGAMRIRRPVLITFDDAYAELAAAALPALARKRFPAVVFVPTDFIGGSNQWDRVHGFDPLPLLDAQAIASWASQGIAFGSHGGSHVDLAAQPSGAVREEMARSARRLREITGAAPDAIAYPFGRVDARVRDEAAGRFSLGFTTEAGRNGLSDDPLLLRRAAVPPAASWLRFRFILAFGFDPVYRWAAAFRPRRWLKNLAARVGSSWA